MLVHEIVYAYYREEIGLAPEEIPAQACIHHRCAHGLADSLTRSNGAGPLATPQAYHILHLVQINPFEEPRLDPTAHHGSVSFVLPGFLRTGRFAPFHVAIASLHDNRVYTYIIMNLCTLIACC
jgi:hypothetical protein